MQHLYQLQPYGGGQTRYTCPQCRHRNKNFVRYINIETGVQLANHVGRCGRQDNCGYHFKPHQYFAANGSSFTPNRQYYKKPMQTITAPSYINPDMVNSSFKHYHRNNFVRYLVGKLGLDTTDELVARYRIGTSKHWPGATVFWQIDAQGNVRTGKIMLYDEATGKRVKKPYNHISWAHSVITKAQANAPYFNLSQCLFGEHLLPTDPDKPVAIVESEKTAVIASAKMPAFVWLASGSLDGLNAAKCSVLKGREVILFPDANCYGRWELKAQELRQEMPGTLFTVSKILEDMVTTTNSRQGFDLADVLL